MESDPVHLKEVQKMLSQCSDAPVSGIDALKQLRAAADKAINYLEDGNTPQGQIYVEQGLVHLMLACHYLNLDVEKAVERQQARQQKEPGQDRVILIFSDHAELRVAGELRGTIPLYSDEDYTELRHIAQLFQCRLEHADHTQLNLLSLLSQKPPESAA